MFVKNILFGVSYIQSLLQLMYIHSLKFVLPKSVCQSRLSVSFKSIIISTMLKVWTQWERTIQKHQVEWKNQCYHLFNGPIQGKIYDKRKVGLTLRECLFQCFFFAFGQRPRAIGCMAKSLHLQTSKNVPSMRLLLQLQQKTSKDLIFAVRPCSQNLAEKGCGHDEISSKQPPRDFNTSQITSRLKQLLY